MFSESLKDEVHAAKLFVVEEYKGVEEEEKLSEGFFSHKLKLLLEKFMKVLVFRSYRRISKNFSVILYLIIESVV